MSVLDKLGRAWRERKEVRRQRDLDRLDGKAGSSHGEPRLPDVYDVGDHTLGPVSGLGGAGSLGGGGGV